MESSMDVCFLFKRRQHPRLVGDIWMAPSIAVLVRDTEPKGKYRYMRRGLLWELARVVMEAEKSYNLLSASGRPRKASDIIQSKGLV